MRASSPGCAAATVPQSKAALFLLSIQTEEKQQPKAEWHECEQQLTKNVRFNAEIERYQNYRNTTHFYAKSKDFRVNIGR